MKNLFLLTCLVFFSITSFAQYGYKDGNRIGISGGVSQTTLFTSNFKSKPGIGYGGGLSVRGNYYNNWSMIYGMQFFINNFSLETTATSAPFLKKDTEFSLSGVQVKLLLSYNVVKDHVSFDFGPVLQINGKMKVDSKDENNIINGTLALKAKQIEEVGSINGSAYVGFSAGTKVVRALIFYQYGFTNALNKLNSQEGLPLLLPNNEKFKGNFGTISGQIIFNL